MAPEEKEKSQPEASEQASEHKIPESKITQLKKSYPALKLVTVTVENDDGQKEVWDLLYTKPSPLQVKTYTNMMIDFDGRDLYGAFKFITIDLLVFPDKDTVRRLCDAHPDLPTKVHGELADFLGSVTETSSKKV